MSTTSVFCNDEDARGCVCHLGPGHKGRHRYGSLNLTDRQIHALAELHEAGRPIELFSPGAEYRSLVNMGLAVSRFIGMRYWYYGLTPTGRVIAQDLPA